LKYEKCVGCAQVKGRKKKKKEEKKGGKCFLRPSSPLFLGGVGKERGKREGGGGKGGKKRAIYLPLLEPRGKIGTRGKEGEGGEKREGGEKESA